jgi:hypothetical protein
MTPGQWEQLGLGHCISCATTQFISGNAHISAVWASVSQAGVTLSPCHGWTRWGRGNWILEHRRFSAHGLVEATDSDRRRMCGGGRCVVGLWSAGLPVK